LSPFEAKLAQRIDEELSRLREQLENRVVINDMSAYSYRVGQMDGLKRVIDSYFHEVNEDLAKEK
jgi:hypothetical protein